MVRNVLMQNIVSVTLPLLISLPRILPLYPSRGPGPGELSSQLQDRAVRIRGGPATRATAHAATLATGGVVLPLTNTVIITGCEI